MNMKKILQAMDGISARPVEGADSMARFLRVVKEADLNKSISETVEYLPPDPEISAQLRAQGDAAMEADRPKHQANAFIRYSSGLYRRGSLPQTINIKPGVTLPVRFNPIKNMDGDVLANATAANKLLPPELQYSSDELLQVVGQKPMQETTAPVPASQTNVSPAIKPYVHAPGPDDPNFDRYVDLMWRYEFLDNERTGKANLIKVDVGVSDEANAEIDRMKYEAEKLAGPNLPAWEKARIGYRTDPEYIKYSQDMTAKLSAELLEDANVASTLPAVTPIKVPPIPQLPAQDGELEGRGIVRTNPDGTRTYSSGMGTFTYDTQGKAITYATPQMMGLGQSINLANNQTTRKYNSGALATSQRVDANGKPLETDVEYDLGAAKMRYNNDHAKGIRSAEFAPGPDFPTDLVSPKDMYAQGNKDKEATYDRAMAQVKGTPVQENSLSKFLSIVRKNDVSILKEGANPHRVALPVQMAMQHYQQPATKPPPRERLIDKYFVEAETEIMQRREEKRALINQYAKTIAERVLMKEGAEGFNTAYLEKAADPNRFGRYMISIEDARAELARRVGSQDPHTEPPTKPIPTGYSKEYLQKAADPNRFGRYMISVEKAQELLKQMNETPIEMTGDANDPHIYGHQKANPMSLKGRIAQARAQLKELAELAESDSLLAWEQICKKAKGGMFMGLEQNLEQIRHGIEELAKQRRKGGTASRGIDKHIGEGKRK